MVTNEDLLDRVAGQTVPSRFLQTARELGDRTALRWRTDDGVWHEWTFGDYLERVARVTAAYEAHGVGRGDRVVLMVRNIPEFHVLDMAAYFVGATPISIYNSSSPEQIEYLVNHCGAVFGVVEDIGFLERFNKVRADLGSPCAMAMLRDPDGLAARTSCLGRHGRPRPGRSRPGGDGGQARRPGHRHLHLRHHGSAQGRHAHPLQRVLDRRVL
jgi:long-chain acyl-CoA synthetase